MASILAGALEKSQWVVQINEFIDRNTLDAASQTPITVFQLPASVCDGDPEAFLPRRVAVGPYHHFRPELFKMDLFKLGKVKNQKWGPQLHHLLDQIKPLDLKIRASFDQPLEMDAETLSWVMLIDGLFLLELLQIRYNPRPLELPLEIFYGKLASEFEIVSDMLKLENQIPLFVLQEICHKQPIDYLAPLFFQFYASVSPFQLPEFDPETERYEFSPIYNLSHHLLHFLYLLILLTPEKKAVENLMRPDSCEEEYTGVYFNCFSTFTFLSPAYFLNECLNILGSVINIAFLQQLKETFSLIQRLVGLLGSITNPNLAEKKIPLVPCASELKTAGLSFKSTKDGILKCRFDETTLTLTLPCIHLDGFSGALLKNLVAYEAMAELNPPCLANYVLLMSGLLRNSKDLKILEKAEIFGNHLESVKEAVEMFSGVEKSSSGLKKQGVLKIHVGSGGSGSEFVREAKMNYDMGLGAMVEEINEWYDKCWRMKMKKFASIVLSCLAILVVVFLIVLVIARFICGFSFVSCPKVIFKTSLALHQTY
ncbi:putative UPF0481 protein At3g02645 [Momordica charantia]|uniref:UPF0481 protein At3g02645 n=1 Tax=Momordica charantia TaxID=3673 RepID=A0A6J1D7A1_MOMCH|nr:putative UPF0481 protein At3g02645 [Momordica charantia]